MSRPPTIIVACLYKFKFGCRGAGRGICRDSASWTLLLFSALTRVPCSRSPPPLNLQQRLAGQTGQRDLKDSQLPPPVNHLVSPSLSSPRNLRNLQGSLVCALGWKPVWLFARLRMQTIPAPFICTCSSRKNWDYRISGNGVLATKNSRLLLSLISGKHLKYFL